MSKIHSASARSGAYFVECKQSKNLLGLPSLPHSVDYTREPASLSAHHLACVKHLHVNLTLTLINQIIPLTLPNDNLKETT